jgi:hypothetical protein
MVLELAALFSAGAFGLALVVIIGENLWVLAAALALMIPARPAGPVAARAGCAEGARQG